ncbi:MAG TPA: ribulokinase [Chloroflexota bacterium]|nr:ribulokinase [Chloroflexota bacterium]
MAKYAIGVDYGTESGRAVLVNVQTGEEVATAVHPYADGVIDEHLPGNGRALPHDFALQNPQDYIEVLKVTVPQVLREGGVSADDVIGIGTDFTACTMLPVQADGTPLCFLPEWRHNPYAWVKLWKHHAAQPQANQLNETARQMGEEWLKWYGGKISSEWLIPKIWETADKAPEVYAAADKFVEAADWIVWQMTGQEKRNACTAGYKAIWHKQKGYPRHEFFAALHPALADVVEAKLSREIYPLGEKAGGLTAEMARLIGLNPGTAVPVGNVDAHVSAPASAVTQPGQMVMIMGTSTCHILIGDQERVVEGMCGVVEDGVVPGLFGYEAGQSCVGDHFAWFVDNGVPLAYYEEAQARGLTIHQLLEEKAAAQKPGAHGLVALDWWNGNRSILVDVDLTGLIVGMTLATKPEDIYRALIEATAYGTRIIIESFEKSGVPVTELVAAGGLPGRNKLLMQIYADVTGRTLKVAGTEQAGAFGSAMFAAVAAGAAVGGYDSIVDAAANMARLQDVVYTPIPEHQAVYDRLFAEYQLLHDYFGRGANDVMKRLKALKVEVQT